MSPASPANGALMQPTRTSNPNANKLDRTSRKKFSRLVAGIIPAILIVFLYVSALGLAGCAVTAGPGAGNTGAFKLTTDSLPAGHAGKAYFSTLAVAGGIAPFSWSVSAGSLPAGVTLGTSDGSLVGTPSKPGSYSVTITVSDSTKQISRKTFRSRWQPAKRRRSSYRRSAGRACAARLSKTTRTCDRLPESN